MGNETLKPMPELKQVINPPQQVEGEVKGTQLSRLKDVAGKYDRAIWKVTNTEKDLNGSGYSGEYSLIPERSAQKEIGEAIQKIQIPQDITGIDLVKATVKVGKRREEVKQQVLKAKTEQVKRKLKENTLLILKQKRETLSAVIEAVEGVEQIKNASEGIFTEKEIANAEKAAEDEIAVLTTPILTKKVSTDQEFPEESKSAVSETEIISAPRPVIEPAEGTTIKEEETNEFIDIELPDGQKIKVLEGTNKAKFLKLFVKTSEENQVTYGDIKEKVYDNNATDITIRTGISAIKSFLSQYNYNLVYHFSKIEVRRGKEQEYYLKKIEIKGDGSKNIFPESENADTLDALNAKDEVEDQVTTTEQKTDELSPLTDKDTFLLAKILYHTVESNADRQAVNDVLDTSDVDESSITEEDKEELIQRMKKLKSNQRDTLIANRENILVSRLLMIISDLDSDVLERLTADEPVIDRNPDSGEKKDRPRENIIFNETQELTPRIFREVNEIVIRASQEVETMHPLTKEEIYLLAAVIKREQGLLTEDEKAEINSIISYSNVDRSYVKNIQARVDLAEKIREYAKDNTQASRINSENNSAKILLKIVGEMDKEELEDFLERWQKI